MTCFIDRSRYSRLLIWTVLSYLCTASVYVPPWVYEPLIFLYLINLIPHFFSNFFSLYLRNYCFSFDFLNIIVSEKISSPQCAVSVNCLPPFTLRKGNTSVFQ